MTEGKPVSPSTTRELPHRVGQDLRRCLARRAASPWSLRRDRENVSAAAPGRHSVGLGEHDIEGDNERAHLGQPRDQVGDARARPRPLAERLEAFLVDIDDDDRPLCRLRAADSTWKKSKAANPQFLERQRIGDAQCSEREQQHEAQCPRAVRTAAPARQAIFMSIERTYSLSTAAARHFSRNIRMN